MQDVGAAGRVDRDALDGVVPGRRCAVAHRAGIHARRPVEAWLQLRRRHGGGALDLAEVQHQAGSAEGHVVDAGGRLDDADAAEAIELGQDGLHRGGAVARVQRHGAATGDCELVGAARVRVDRRHPPRPDPAKLVEVAAGVRADEAHVVGDVGARARLGDLDPARAEVERGLERGLELGRGHVVAQGHGSAVERFQVGRVQPIEAAAAAHVDGLLRRQGRHVEPGQRRAGERRLSGSGLG